MSALNRWTAVCLASGLVALACGVPPVEASSRDRPTLTTHATGSVGGDGSAAIAGYDVRSAHLKTAEVFFRVPTLN